ncbi:hypothetical protein ACUUYQ_09280 [Bacillus halotolerans]|uniref:hypothetical protein n=1 Tax=Bacillus halotolerans TaxID=260554 RepID=UPI0040462350
MSGLSQDQINVDLFNEVQHLKKEKQHDQEEIQRLRSEKWLFIEALEFYAEETTYTKEFEDCPPAIDLDGGQTARKALKGEAE